MCILIFTVFIIGKSYKNTYLNASIHWFYSHFKCFIIL